MPYLIITYIDKEDMIKPIINIETKDDPHPTPACPFAQTFPVVPICMFSQQSESQVMLGFNFNDARGFYINLVKEAPLPFDLQNSLSKLEHGSNPERSRQPLKTFEELPNVKFGESMSSPDPLLLETKPRCLRPRDKNRKNLGEPRVTKKKAKTNGRTIKCTHAGCKRNFASTGGLITHLKSH
ncbi:hypothetical protein MMC10_005017 [Thelotrema lepadinum]|nr:hypothetical protein [Thelotrema lepadinum]